MTDFDAVVVGASLAGCATAIHLGRAGHRVALVDKRPGPGGLQARLRPLHPVQRRPRARAARRAGGARGRRRRARRTRACGRPSGWFAEPPGDGRRALAEHPARAARPAAAPPRGRDARRRAAARPRARRAPRRAPGGRRVELSRGPALTTRLLVGADGRGSRTAALAGVRTRTSANARFAYWGYFEGPPLGTGASVHIWFRGRDIGIATPTDGGLMLYVAFPAPRARDGFKADIEGELRAFVGALPDAPPIAESRLAGPLVGKLDLTNEWRRPAGPALALVGDAALAADPVGAVGCGWALQSAEWLAEAVSPALHGERRLAAALRAYRRRHRRELLGHSLMAADAARAKPPAPPQRLLFAAAVHDPVTARRVAAFAAREIRPHSCCRRARSRAPRSWSRATRAPRPGALLELPLHEAARHGRRGLHRVRRREPAARARPRGRRARRPLARAPRGGPRGRPLRRGRPRRRRRHARRARRGLRRRPALRRARARRRVRRVPRALPPRQLRRHAEPARRDARARRRSGSCSPPPARPTASPSRSRCPRRCRPTRSTPTATPSSPSTA